VRRLKKYEIIQSNPSRHAVTFARFSRARSMDAESTIGCA